jgi:hypothetical protein
VAPAGADPGRQRAGDVGQLGRVVEVQVSRMPRHQSIARQDPQEVSSRS